jgi:carboxyl-terminal processing protease
MKRHFLFNRFTVCFLFALALGISACKKSHSDSDPQNGGTPGVPSGGTRKQLTLDSIYLYAKQIYFWNDAIPDYTTFNPRQYSSKSVDLDNYNAELYALSQLKINPATGQAYEYYGDGAPKYSFIDDLTQDNPSVSASVNDKASVDTEGNGNDIGIRPVFYLYNSTSTTPYDLMVTAVYPGSPAAAAGVKRGWKIQKINGTAVGANYGSERTSAIAALDGASVKIEGVNSSDQVPFSVTLNKASYKSSPVYTSSVITRSGKKIGYLAFARFSVLSNPSDASPSDVNLDPVFANFSSQGVTDLIVDLRYNGGGYVNTAEYLADLIGPSSIGNKVLFTEFYNSTMQSGKATILSHQPLLTAAGKVQYQNGKLVTYADLSYSPTDPSNITNFTKKGSLSNVTNIVFIVSGNTASASELLINSLKPYMTVKLLGSTTYGKPVGFFPFVLENRYQVYIPLFETKNASGAGGYYTGMVPDVSVNDNSVYPFGDEREQQLSAALNVIAPGSVSQGASSSVADRSLNVPAVNYSGAAPANPNSEFKGMILRPHLPKK